MVCYPNDCDIICTIIYNIIIIIFILFYIKCTSMDCVGPSPKSGIV